VNELGWCEPDNFEVMAETNEKAQGEDEAAGQVGGVQSIFLDQIKIFTNINIMSIPSLVVAGGTDSLQADLTE